MIKDNVSIIIPLKSTNTDAVIALLRYIVSLNNDLAYLFDNYEIIIVDECRRDIAILIENAIENTSKIVHIVPASEDRTGNNDKLNGIYAAVKIVKYNYIFIVDDHYRITGEKFLVALQYFEIYDMFKVVPVFDKYTFSVMLDEAGFFFRSFVNKTKQYAGHIALKHELFVKYGFPCRDALYDEYVVEKYYQDKGCSVGFPPQVFFSATQKITTKKFLEQRIRYAYENIAFPLRFIIHLLFLPSFVIGVLANLKVTVILLLIYSIFIAFISFVGQRIYGAESMPKYLFMLAPIWHLFYWVTSWISLFLYFSGGICFGERRIHKPG